MNASAQTVDSIVTVTDAAAAEIRRLLAEDASEGLGLRLGIRGGGCSGLSYVLDLDLRRETDIVQSGPGFDVFMDRKSSLYLKGVVLDFKGGLQDRGFKFQNPNATNTCGCGTSFSV